MKKIAVAAALLAALPALADDLLPEARKVATMVPPKLLAVLTTEIEKGGKTYDAYRPTATGTGT